MAPDGTSQDDGTGGASHRRSSRAVHGVLELDAHPITAMCGLLLAGTGATVWADYGDEAVPPPLTAEQALYLGRSKIRVSAADVGPLLPTVDVVLTSLSDADLAERGIDLAVLESVHPHLVVGRASVLGRRGRNANYAGGELQALALSGVLGIVGDADREPVRLAGIQAQYSAGAALFSGVLAAAFARTPGVASARRGVSTSAVRAAAYLDWKSMAHYEDDGTVLVRGSDRGPIRVRCEDGFVGLYYTPADWEKVKAIFRDGALGDPRFASQAGRDTHRDELLAAFEKASRGRRKDEIYREAQRYGLPTGAVLTIDDLRRDPQYTARGSLEPLGAVSGPTLEVPGVPWTVDGRRPTDPATGVSDHV